MMLPKQAFVSLETVQMQANGSNVDAASHQSTERTPTVTVAISPLPGALLTVISVSGGAVSRAVDAPRHVTAQSSLCFNDNGSDAAE